MLKINEEVLIGLIKRGVEIEENNAYILLKLFIVENDERRRKIIYQLLRDTEYHKSMLTECLRSLRGDIPLIAHTRDYGFEDMFATQKVAVIKEIISVVKDFYAYLFEDLEKVNLSGFIDKDLAKKILDNIKAIIQEKEEQLKLINNLSNSI